MSGVLGRRRHYRYSHTPRITPVKLMRGDRGLLVWQSLPACTAVAILCASAIVTIWIATNREIRAQQDKALAHGQAVVVGQANLLAEAARQELNTIDQSLTILQAAWNSDPAGFDLKSWQSHMPALTEVASDIFVANEKRLIVQDVLPQAIGQGIGAAYVEGGNGSLQSVLQDNRAGRDPGLVVGERGIDGIIRHYVMYVLRPLHRPAGWLIGASYRSAALAKVFAEGSLGTRGVAALIDTRHGGVQAVAGPAALRPRLNVAESAMYQWIEQQKANGGIWIGPTAMDNETRIHAYRRIPGRDLVVLAGVDETDWMAPATEWARGARLLAALGSLLVAGIGAMALWLLWKLDTNRRRRFALEQAAIRLNSAQSGLQTAEIAAQTGMAQVQAMMAGCSDGIALFNAEWRLAAWNPPFAAFCGLPSESLRIGRAVDELLRQQAQCGRFGPLRDIEAEIAQRLARLRTDKEPATFHQLGPDGQTLTVRGCTMPDGGMMLIVTGATVPLSRQLPPPGQPVEEATKPDSAQQPPVEW